MTSDNPYTRWVHQHSSREDHFVTLLHNVNWSSLDPAFVAGHLDSEDLYMSSQEALLIILHFLEKNNIKLNSKHGDMYRELHSKLLPNNELEQELDDSTSFLSFAISSAVMKDLEHSEVDETFSSYILQTEPIGEPNQYVPYRHPSGCGNEMEVYKSETDTPQEMMSFHPPLSKKSAASPPEGESRPEENKIPESTLVSDVISSTQLQDGGGAGHHTIPPDPVYDIAMEQRHAYRTEERNPSTENVQPAPPPSGSQYPTHSPAGSEANLNFRNHNLENCDEVYKHYGSHSGPDIPELYYRQQNNYALKPNNQNFGNPPDSRCMQYNAEHVVGDEDFNQDIFKNDLIMYNREEYRNPNYSCSMFREGPMYNNDVDSYRNMCHSQQYDNFKMEGDQGIKRPDYPTCKEDSGLRSSPVEPTVSRPEKIERLNSNRSDFDFSTYQILEQVINEERLCEKTSTATKRYDPKFRALAEAFKQTEPELASQAASQNQTMFEYKATSTPTTRPSTPNAAEDKIRLEPGNCRISEKSRSKERLDCQYSNQLEMKVDYEEIAVPPPCSQYPRVDSQPDKSIPEEDIAQSDRQDIISFQNPPDNSFSEPEPKVTYPDSAVLETPPKKVVESSLLGGSKSSSKSSSQQIILTPKEKYAKEINAERKLESIQKNLEVAQINELLTAAEKEVEERTIQTPPPPQCDSRELLPPSSPHISLYTTSGPPAAPPPPLRKVPLGLKILRAKKKLASQKKLILEHGEVRLTYKQKVKLKMPRKRSAKPAVPDARRIKSAVSSVEDKKSITEYAQELNDSVKKIGSSIKETQTVFGTDNEPQTNGLTQKDSVQTVKKIINRKDKLLAEHRSRLVMPASPPPQQQLKELKPAPHDDTINLDELVIKIELTCPFCDFVCVGKKHYHKHIKVYKKFTSSNLPDNTNRK